MPGPFFREAGTGPAVVCLHANASTSGQWRALMERLAGRFRVIAVDTYGAGKSPEWPGERRLQLADEVALLEPVFGAAGASFHLVGHSYGAAIALKAALLHPGRVRSMALYEPTLFALLEEEKPGQPAAQEIHAAAQDAARAVERGAMDAAAERFIDYWMGEGSWQAMPPERRPAVAASMRNIAGWEHALFTEPTPLAAFAQLRIPILYLVGARSRASARGVARLLTRTLPQATVGELEGVGHMAPVTHPELVNARIEAFLGEQ
jgi:pimeloyl-ACP methyl ester carboxylesterase